MKSLYSVLCSILVIVPIVLQASEQTGDFKEIDGKLYVPPGSVYVAPNAIYISMNGNLVSVPKIASDSIGIYIEDYDCYYTPWHDDDWQCDNGHWSPYYDNKCVMCGKPKKSSSPRWKNRK